MFCVMYTLSAPFPNCKISSFTLMSLKAVRWWRGEGYHDKTVKENEWYFSFSDVTIPICTIFIFKEAFNSNICNIMGHYRLYYYMVKEFIVGIIFFLLQLLICFLFFNFLSLLKVNNKSINF